MSNDLVVRETRPDLEPGGTDVQRLTPSEAAERFPNLAAYLTDPEFVRFELVVGLWALKIKNDPEEPYDQGYEAGYHGLMADNPFASGNPKAHREWNMGRRDGAAAHRRLADLGLDE